MIVREALAQGSADLKFADISSPSLDASLLLAHVLKITRSSLTAEASRKLSEKDCAAFCELIERRASGECVAYIIGKKEFWGIDFEVNSKVLVPRPDTETLVEAALKIIDQENPQESPQESILDICTGSGAAAIALKYERPKLDVWAADICSDALNTAKKNAACLLPDYSQINFLAGDLFDALSNQNIDIKFSVIVSNPPYIPSHEIQTLRAEVQHEPRLALDGGESGLDIIERIIEKAHGYLQNGGSVLLEADPRQMEAITNLLEKAGFCDIQLYNDLSGSQRVIRGKWRG